jgi:hypothetical protein
MINNIDRIIGKLSALPIDDVKTAYIQRFYIERDRLDHVTQRLIDNGYEWIDDPVTPITDDGREVLRIGRRAFALRPEIHADRLREALEHERSMREAEAAQQSAQSESVASITCPQMVSGKPCGGALNRAPVCPSCVTGRMGYKYRYTCESCGCDIVTRGELK